MTTAIFAKAAGCHANTAKMFAPSAIMAVRNVTPAKNVSCGAKNAQMPAAVCYVTPVAWNVKHVRIVRRFARNAEIDV